MSGRHFLRDANQLRDGGQDPTITGGGMTPVGRTEDVTGFANYTGAWTCKSRAGRWRPAHEYLGGTCIYCDLVEPEPVVEGS